MGEPERLEHGWLSATGKFICDGCGVREGHEHRCCRDDGTWADPRQVCACSEPGCFGEKIVWKVAGMNFDPAVDDVLLRSEDGRERRVPNRLPLEIPAW